MRIVIDMLGAQTDSRFRGIGRYTLSLTQAMVRRNTSHEIILVVNAQMPESIRDIKKLFEDLLPPEQIRVFDVPASPRYPCWENTASEFIRESFIATLHPDVVLLTSVVEDFRVKATSSVGCFASNLKTAAVFYDLIPLLHPETYLTNQEDRRFYLQKVDWIKRVDLLLGISESSCKEAIDHLKKSTDQVSNISAAVGPEFFPRILTVKQKLELLLRLGIDDSRELVLYVPGGCDPRKNFSRIFQAFSELPEDIRANHQLVIVSKLSPDNRKVLVDFGHAHQLNADEFILTGFVEDTDLFALYSIAKLFVFPSLHEGFGLPVLEAMACGAPVIGSNCTSISEVIGCNEALFDPQSVIAIRAKMLQALTQDEFRSQLKKHALNQAKLFSWENSAEKALMALESLHYSNLETTPNAPTPLTQQALIDALSQVRGHESPDEFVLQKTASCLVFNRGIEHPQLLLDVTEPARGDARSGIQRVVRSILSECLNSPPSGFIVRPIRFDGTRYWYANRLGFESCGRGNPLDDSPADFFQGDVYLCLDLLMHLNANFYQTHRDLSDRGVLLHYIVYDLLPLQNGQWWPKEVRPMYEHWISELSQQAGQLICISQAVANELNAWLEAHPPKRSLKGPRVSSFHLGADVKNSLPSQGLPEEAGALLKQIADSPSFLMVGTLEPRKGHDQALAAFERLWAQGHEINLIIVGKRGWKVDALVHILDQHAERGQRLHWVEGASDEYLERLYASCDCLIFASLGEGFGLPLIEAAQHKLPILTRDLPVLREVAGDHAMYFEGTLPCELADAVERWLNLKESGQQPNSSSLPWLTWKQSTQQLLAAMGITNTSSF